MTYVIRGTDVEVKDGEPSAPVLVISRSRTQFLRWCSEVNLNHTSPNVKDVWDIQDVLNYENGWYIDLDERPRRPGSHYALVIQKMKSQGFREIP